MGSGGAITGVNSLLQLVHYLQVHSDQSHAGFSLYRLDQVGGQGLFDLVQCWECTIEVIC